MEYPLISEYREAIMAAEDNFRELASLRPVLDSHGDPVMSSGNFAVVFKMKDENDGKLYAVKCFIKGQENRDESYRKIEDELEMISSSYILPLRYLENELFVDSAQCSIEEFPIVVMEWVEDESLDAYLNRNLNDKYELEMLSYRFNRMAAWLLAQPFAHGDLKPDNILVRKDDSLVLVDYDGMFVPSMKGEKAREIGSPDYRHPSRTDSDFNENIDDFSIAVIALSLKAIAINPQLKLSSVAGDTLLFSENDFLSPSDSVQLKNVQNLTDHPDISMLLGVFYIALAKRSLEMVSFRLFMTAKPKQEEQTKDCVSKPIAKINTSCTEEDLAGGIPDEYGVLYSPDGKRLLKCSEGLNLTKYKIKHGVAAICDEAFNDCNSLHSVEIPDTVSSIGDTAFAGCSSLQYVKIPNSVIEIGFCAFSGCSSLQRIKIPNSVTAIEFGAFTGCSSLQIIEIPDSVTAIEFYAFAGCSSLQRIKIPNSVITIEDEAFRGCSSLQSVEIPNSVTTIGDRAFSACSSLQIIEIPDSVTDIRGNPFSECLDLRVILTSDSSFRVINNLLINSSGVLISCQNKSERIIPPTSVTTIGDGAFDGCESLKSIQIPDSVTAIGDRAFYGCKSLKSIQIPDSVTAIGDRAFDGCKSLKSIQIPDSVTAIGDEAFCCCESLQRIRIPDSVTAIGNMAFCWCKSLQRIRIPDSVTAIGNMAFCWCESLQRIEIPKSVINIGKNAFPSGCKIVHI